jgi:hypothetical protein
MKLTEQKLREIIQSEIKSLNEKKETTISVDDSNFKSTKKRHKAVSKEFPNAEIVDHKKGDDKRYSVYTFDVVDPWEHDEFKVSGFDWYENTVTVRYTSKTKDMTATYAHEVTDADEFMSILKKKYVKSDWK